MRDNRQRGIYVNGGRCLLRGGEVRDNGTDGVYAVDGGRVCVARCS